MYNAANNASSQLAQAIGAEDTSLTVLDGSDFPDAPFVVSIEDEIIEVGGKDGNTFSALVRGLEGTTPAAHLAGVRVENRFTAGTYQQVVNDLLAHTEDLLNPHNVASDQIEYTSGVTGFTPVHVKTALDALADVRIVEMGSNENGEYVKWENGLQVCWRSRLTLTRATTTQAYDTWTFPATFLNTDYSVLITQAWISGDTPAQKPTMAFTQVRRTSDCKPTLASKDDDLADGEYWGVHLVAIGRWK